MKGVELTSIEQWAAWSEKYSVLPYIRKYPGSLIQASSWEEAWKRAGLASFVLESGKAGRYTLLGLRPSAMLMGKGNSASLYNDQGHRIDTWAGEPLKLVKRWFEPFRSPAVAEAPKFTGGLVGYWSYDVARSIERLPEIAEDDLQVPDYAFMRMDQLWIVDREEQALYCAVYKVLPRLGAYGSTEYAERSLDELYREAAMQAEAMKAEWDEITGTANPVSELLEGATSAWRRRLYERSLKGDCLSIDVEGLEGVERAFGKQEFMQAVRSIQDYIRRGDVFQVNLSVRQSKTLTSSPEAIYEWLRIMNPSPYMGLLRFADFQLVSGSPELLVGIEAGEIRTRPIAGTRPRGASPEEDVRLAEELIRNEKERAEHVMLVDLLRNDLGRVSEYGTVKLDDFMTVERYSHVMHIVSGIVGKLTKDRDAFDVMAAVFPGGTITGAPKIRTMEIIEELEPVRRGPYTGSIGWIDYNGNMEFNIVIRTLLVKGGRGYVQAGAGIVIDSDPEREYEEAINKAKAVWKAIQYSEQQLEPSIGGEQK